MLIRADINQPNILPDRLSQWLDELVAAVGMKVLIPSQCVRCETPGNEGVTGIVCLETSHASIHVWDSGYLQADLYSCKPFDPYTVADLFHIFEPSRLTFVMLDRNGDQVQTFMEETFFFDLLTDDMEGTQAAVRQAIDAA
jgi:S-adenosylmethionine/arginine decarboxylase-like enzyme